MFMDYKDYLLLNYLSEFNEPIKPTRGNVPITLGITFNFHGVDMQKDPNSIIGRLTHLKNNGLVKEPGANWWQISAKGKEALKGYISNMPKLSFEEQCDRVLDLIVKQEKQPVGNTLNTLEIAEKLDVDYELVEAIADEFSKQKLVTLAVDNGHEAFIVMPAARSFYHRSSFVKEKEKQDQSKIRIETLNDHSIKTYGNNSPIISGDKNLLEIKSNEPDPLTQELTKKQLDDFPEAKRSRRNTYIWMIVGIILATILGVLTLL